MSLSIHDVLRLPGLESLRLRAGRAGEYHTVRWPHVAESETIAEWVQGGELVFLTGINLPRSEDNLKQLVREAHERKCAGLVVLTGSHHIPEIPETVLREAERLSLPLIEQPYHLPMVVVTEAIGSALVREQMLGNTRQQLMEQLLDGSIADETLLAHRAQRLGIDLGSPKQVLVLQLAGTGELFREVGYEAAEARMLSFRQEVLQGLSNCLQAPGLAPPIVVQAEQWIALPRADASEASLANRRAVEQLLESLNTGSSPLRVFAGLSAVCARTNDLSTGLAQARQALMAAQSFPDRLGLSCFDELGVLELLVSIRDRGLLDRFVNSTLGPLLQFDKSYKGVLTKTLEAWMQTNGNLMAAARRLDLHRNTLNHRMSQIQSMLSMDLNNAQSRLSISVALMIWRLSSHQQKTPSEAA